LVNRGRAPPPAARRLREIQCRDREVAHSRSTGSAQDLAGGGAPFAGAAVYVWHCDREGRYSLYSDGATRENYLRGVQIADAAGKAIATSQVALPKDACDAVYAKPGYDQSVRNLAQVSLDNDNVFGDDGGATQLGTVSGDAASGYTVTLAVRVDTRTTPTGGGVPGSR
jgi:hypothetical protein